MIHGLDINICLDNLMVELDLETVFFFFVADFQNLPNKFYKFLFYFHNITSLFY